MLSHRLISGAFCSGCLYHFAWSMVEEVIIWGNSLDGEYFQGLYF